MINSITLGHKNSPVKNLVTFSLKHRLVVLFILIVGIILVAAYKLPIRNISKVAPATTANTNTLAVNKEFAFPIYNNDGKETQNSLKISLTEVERTDKILVNGKPASARDGKDFLVMYVEINNPTNDKLNVRPVDFFRMVDDAGNSYAADVHNDPVKAEPISIKKTRIGYVVDENQNTFKFLVGEITGEKQNIEINI